MDIQSATTPSSGPVSTQNSGGSPLASDFQDFIELLTAQAKYQDPLEPINSTEYVSQLAQFSMLEQQVLTNELMSAQLEQVATTTMASLSGWVGMEARAATPIAFDGTPVTVSPNPAAISDSVQLVVYNDGGEEVQRVPLPVSAEPYQWAGVDPATGAPFADGIYSFQVESYASGELILNEQAEVYGLVTEAQSQAGQIVLILEGGQPVLSTSVTAIRDPSGL